TTALVFDLAQNLLWPAAKSLLGIAQRNSLWRPRGPRQAGHHGREIEFQPVAVASLRGCRGMEHSLFLRVGFDELDERLRAAREAKVANRLGVYGENAASRAVFGGHVGDGGAVGKRQVN